MDLQLHVQSIPIATKVVSSNPIHDEVYLIQRYVINLSVTCDSTPISSTNETDRHDITEILLKVALSTISHNYMLKGNT